MNAEQKPSSSTAPRAVNVDGDRRKYLQKISVGPHLLQADELVDVGGTDSGPSPHELLLAALGACISTTLRMFADRKQWSLETVHVGLSHRKISVQDSGEIGATSRLVDQIDVGVSLTGHLTEDQKNKLMEIAGKCPIHRALVSGVQIRTNAIEPSPSPQ